MFSEQELAFLRTQPLARLATVAVTGQPDADAVGFAFENGHFSIGGYFLERTRKWYCRISWHVLFRRMFVIYSCPDR